MHRSRLLPLAGIALVAAGCGGTTDQPAAAPSSSAPELLPHPFTAEQIRDTWQPGLALVLRTTDSDGESFERWTVVDADGEGATIEFTPVDAAGQSTGEPRIARSSWIELRDHASFPAASASREPVTDRETPLGRLDGWLYTVRDDEGGTTEFFFAAGLPGAPVTMRTTRDGATVRAFEQVARVPAAAGG